MFRIENSITNFAFLSSFCKKDFGAIDLFFSPLSAFLSQIGCSQLTFTTNIKLSNKEWFSSIHSQRKTVSQTITFKRFFYIQILHFPDQSGVTQVRNLASLNYIQGVVMLLEVDGPKLPKSLKTQPRTQKVQNIFLTSNFDSL